MDFTPEDEQLLKQMQGELPPDKPEPELPPGGFLHQFHVNIDTEENIATMPAEHFMALIHANGNLQNAWTREHKAAERATKRADNLQWNLRLWQGAAVAIGGALLLLLAGRRLK